MLLGSGSKIDAVAVQIYSPVERTLLDVRPGITDLASIVFADEGDQLLFRVALAARASS